MPDFDLGAVHLDHLASALQLTWMTWQQVSTGRRSQKKATYDRQSLTRGSLTSVLCQQVANAWDDDIETHVADYTHNLKKALAYRTS